MSDSKHTQKDKPKQTQITIEDCEEGEVRSSRSPSIEKHKKDHKSKKSHRHHHHHKSSRRSRSRSYSRSSSRSSYKRDRKKHSKKKHHKHHRRDSSDRSHSRRRDRREDKVKQSSGRAKEDSKAQPIKADASALKDHKFNRESQPIFNSGDRTGRDFLQPPIDKTKPELLDISMKEDSDLDLFDDEEAQLKREMEERQRRMEEIKRKHQESMLKPESKDCSPMILDSPQVIVEGQQVLNPPESSNFQENTSLMDQGSTLVNENPIDSNLNMQSPASSEQMSITNITEEVKQAQEAIQHGPNHMPSDKMLEFYKMVDHQRDDWYAEQIHKEQKIEEPLSNKKQKNLDMFDSESSEDEDALQETINKGFQITQGQVDQEGYYQPKVGELFNNRYKVKGIAGRGVFSCVVKATDTLAKNPLYQEVAIKVIRMFDIMRQSGEKEKEIVTLLNKVDAKDNRHIIRMLDTFEYNNHLCLVYECMEINLRETLNKYGKGVGLSLDGVCLYGRQLFLALSLLHKLKLIHADLKPDNIMVSKDTKKIKLCDFGSCLSVDEAGITEYMVSRFYRAPEIMLGCAFDQAIDVWSAGVSLFELYTGQVMFPGRSNNEMLKLIMQTKGKIKGKILKRSSFLDKHFNPQNPNIFLAQEDDPLQKGNVYVKAMPMPAIPSKPIIQMLKTVGSKDDQKNLQLFADFLEKCLIIDPKKRMNADEALNHPFLLILQERAAALKK